MVKRRGNEAHCKIKIVAAEYVCVLRKV